MPLGLNRTDLNMTGISYYQGFPVTLPHTFGNQNRLTFGNPIPTSGTEQNKIPAYGGNTFASYILLETGQSITVESGTGQLLKEQQ